MKHLIFITFILLSITNFLYSQNIDNSTSTPKQEYLNAEDFIFDEKFDCTISLYQNLLSENTENADLNFKLGFCLLNSQTGRFSAINYLEKAVKIYESNNQKSEYYIAAMYYLARAYHVNYEFDNAISEYKKLSKYAEKKKLSENITFQLNLSKSAKILFENPKDLVVTKLGIVNSNYADHSPVISADESVMYFTSKREGSTGGKQTADNQYYEDIYVYNKKNGISAKPENIGKPINTQGHEATCGLSVDGQELFIYKSIGKDNGNIYHSQLIGNKWSEPKILGKNINSKRKETHASLSSDGKLLFFSSFRKGGEGGSDIYVSSKKSDGTWGKAKNIGKSINTNLNEEGPYIHPDGKTLYFSSQGHEGMGGYDIFYSNLKSDETWSEPVNMGFPLNTVDNDVFYIPSADGERGYYSSQKGGVSDIYIANLFQEDKKIVTLVSGITKDSKVYEHYFSVKDCRLQNDSISLPDGRLISKLRNLTINDSVTLSDCDFYNDTVFVVDSVYSVPNETKIYVLDADNKQLENSYGSNIVTGKYLVVLNQRKDYKIYFESDGYIFDTKNISLKNDTSFRKEIYNAEIDVLKKGKILKCKTVSFNPKTNELINFTSLEMDLLANFMKKNSNLSVNFSGFDYLVKKQDPRFFPAEYAFAEGRQKSLTDYLISKGIKKERILVDLSPNSLRGDSIEYTIYDEITLQQAIKDKINREKSYDDALSTAQLDDEQIREEYGLDEVFTMIKVEVENMIFEINKSKSDKYDDNLQTLADYLIQNTSVKIEIGGYTDLQGSKEYNKRLAQKRANFVKDDLISKGVDKNQLIIKNYNIENPISRNKTKTGEIDKQSIVYNRRVEIKVIQQGDSAVLEVKQIEVPEQYKIIPTFNPESYVYSINLKTSETQIPLEEFSKYEDVQETLNSDDTYIYYYGEFETEQEAVDALLKLRPDFPEAFVFIKDF